MVIVGASVGNLNGLNRIEVSTNGIVTWKLNGNVIAILDDSASPVTQFDYIRLGGFLLTWNPANQPVTLSDISVGAL